MKNYEVKTNDYFHISLYLVHIRTLKCLEFSCKRTSLVNFYERVNLYGVTFGADYMVKWIA